MKWKTAKRIFACILTAALFMEPAAVSASGQDSSGAEKETVQQSTYEYREGDFVLFQDNVAGSIYLDQEKELPQVQRAAGDLVTDIEAVTGKKPSLKQEKDGYTENMIIIGTVGQGGMVDRLAAAGKLDLTGVTGEWEAFTLQTVDHPYDGVNKALVIAGSDKRGTIYGIYEVSEMIGVSPWYWWGDVPVRKKTQVILPAEKLGKIEKPDVKYRGIFLNDEENFTSWSERFENKTDSPGTPNAKTYSHVFEIMLRLKANILWPAMHEKSDAFNAYVNEKTGVSYNAEMAERYGVIMGSSHAEMLLCCNPTEWAPWCEKNKGKYNLKKLENDWKKSYDYTVNPEAMNAYWEDRVASNYKFENTYTIGLRAVHDAGILCSALGSNATYQQKAGVVKKAVAAQLEILKKYEQKYEQETGQKKEFPKVFCPYKEAAEYYKYDLGLPDDTIILWCDDNYGYVRQHPTVGEQQKYAGGGVYYHVSYWGWPCSYLWMATTPLSLMYEEMYKSYTAGSDDYWILNVGDLKPSEIPMEFFLDMAWDVESVHGEDPAVYMAEKFQRDFTLSSEEAEGLADLLTEAYQLGFIKKPEFAGLNQGTEFSVTDYGDEGQQFVNQWVELDRKSNAICQKLPENERAAYYQLIHYMIRSSMLTAKKTVYAQKSRVYKQQGRFLSVSAYAGMAEEAYKQVLQDVDHFNYELSSGKWKHILDPYTNVNGLPKIQAEPDTASVSAQSADEGLDAVCEGQVTGNENVTLEFHSRSDDARFIDIFTTGYQKQTAQIETGKELMLTDAAGKELSCETVASGRKYSIPVEVEKRVWLKVDWTEAAEGKQASKVTVSNGQEKVKEFSVSFTKAAADETKKGYYETNGVVSLEAEHYNSNVPVDGREWKPVKDLGVSGDLMKVYPDTNSSQPCLFSEDTLVQTAIQTAPYLEYNVYFGTTGTYDAVLYRLPALNEGKYDDGTAKSARILVGLDDGTAKLLRGNTVVEEKGGSAWSINVQESMERLAFSIDVADAGWHTVRVIQSDAGIAFDKIDFVHSDKTAPASRTGVPESVQTIAGWQTPKIAAVPEIRAEGLKAAGTETEDQYLFDFSAQAGSVQKGYTGVTASASGRKFRWKENGQSDRKAVYRSGAAKCSDRDKGFVYGSTEDTFIFKTQTKNKYRIGIAVGDRGSGGISVSGMTVKANGKKVLGDIAVKNGGTMEYTFTATPDENKEIALTFTGNKWSVASVEAWQEKEPLKDDGKGAFIKDSKGYINIEAEAALENSDYAKIIPVKSDNEISWHETNGKSGSALFFGPNSTKGYTSTNYSTNLGPKAEYVIDFKRLGSYHVWLRLKAESIEDDSILLFYDEKYAAVLNDVGVTGGGYVWKKAAVLDVTETGEHKLTLGGREDGLAVDQIVLSTNSAAPAGQAGKMVRNGASSYDKEESENQKETAADKAKKLNDALSRAKKTGLSEKERREIIDTLSRYLPLMGDKILAADVTHALRACYSFEGSFKDSVTGTEIGKTAHTGSNSDPVITKDDQRGQVLSVKAGLVEDSSMLRVTNPLRGSDMKKGASISVWVKAPAIDNYGFIWSFSNKYNYAWLAGAPYFGYDGGRGFIDLNCPHNLPGSSDLQGYLKNDSWNLVTTTMTGSEVCVYVNGEKKLSTRDRKYAAGQNIDNAERVMQLLKDVATIQIGGNNLYWGPAGMMADDFMIFDEAVSEEQILHMYYGKVERSIVSLVLEQAQAEINKNIYTADSIKVLQTEMEKAKKVYQDAKAAERDYILAFNSLKTAIGKLQKKTSAPADPVKTVYPSSITAAVKNRVKSTIYLAKSKKKQTLQIKASVQPAKADQKVKYSSSNKKLATVTAKGKVVIRKNKTGKAKITVQSVKKTAKGRTLKKIITIRVVKKRKGNKKLVPGSARKLTLKKKNAVKQIRIKKLTSKTTDPVTYKVTKGKKYVRVDQYGVISCRISPKKKKKEAKIRVACGKKNYVIRVTVKK